MADCIAQVQTDSTNEGGATTTTTGKGTNETIFGFTFSFPTQQESISTGRLITWSKGWATSGCIGEEVTALFETALKKRGIKGRVAALINDTVGTLAAKVQENRDVRVGVILGTGN